MQYKNSFFVEGYFAAFEKTAKDICNAVTNHHFNLNFNTRIKCDASRLGLGASLEQGDGGVRK